MAIIPFQPTDPAQRLELLDALRGFALAGVLLSNLLVFTQFAYLDDAGRAALPSAGLDRVLEPALNLLVTGKFLTLFSLLFGVGFALQMQRADDDADPTSRRRRRYLRRLAVLLVIGLAHAWLWWGDILRYYALLGLLLLPLQRLSTRALAVLGAVLAVVPHPLFAQLFAAAGPALASQEQAHAAALAAFGDTRWPPMLHGNRVFGQWWMAKHWGLACTVAGCLLVGAALGRSGVLRDPAAHPRFWRRLRLALPLGLLLAVGLTLSAYGRLPSPAAGADGGIARMGLRMLHDAATMLLGLGYLAGFAWLFGRARWRRGLQWLAPVGRMALSNYLLQTLAGIALFYGVGLGWGPRWGLPGLLAAWAAVFAAQVALSHAWLARFRFGPAEWAWRSVTYGRRQPLRR
ncbi:DUF418 domain-containing protein [Lysobacter koreensis]|uniref:DUF418 domain-containing protein n=1 Tax=Lysobacter koreensis TaxID=266122 RepID=A0ABW2YLZ9_9GAMM